MDFELGQEETLIKEGSANLQRNIETVGGALFLTNQRLIFKPHKLSIQKELIEIGLGEIQSLTPSWTRFLNLIPIFPNSLSLLTNKGDKYRFVLFKRADWAVAIEAQRNAKQFAGLYEVRD